MSLKETYVLIKTMQEEIGGNCRVTFSAREFGLDISVTWEVGNTILNYRRIEETKQLTFVPDEVLLKRFVELAISEYKLRTVGEE